MGGPAASPPREQVRGLGQPFAPSHSDASGSDGLRVQPGPRAGSSHAVVGRTGVQGGTEPLVPTPGGAVTLPQDLSVGMLRGV